MSRNQGSKTKKPILILSSLLIITAVLAGSVFGVKAYKNSQENKIYAINQSVKFPDFEMTVVKAELKTVELPLNNELVNKYGGLKTVENCDTFSRASSMTLIDTEYVPYGASDYNICNRRNDTRKSINSYTDANRLLVVDYKIVAKNTVNTEALKIEIIPDSGRNLKEDPNVYMREFQEESFYEFLVDGKKVERSIIESEEHLPYFASDLGNNVGKGLSRTGYLFTDVRSSENTADLVISYDKNGKTHTRTVRLNLK